MKAASWVSADGPDRLPDKERDLPKIMAFYDFVRVKYFNLVSECLKENRIFEYLLLAQNGRFSCFRSAKRHLLDIKTDFLNNLALKTG